MSTETITDETLQKLKAEHGSVLHLGNEFGEAVFRVPSDTEWQRFQDELADQETRGAAMKPLVIACCVYPEPPRFLDMIKRRPGLVATFGGEIVDFAGVKKVTVRKIL